MCQCVVLICLSVRVFVRPKKSAQQTAKCRFANIMYILHLQSENIIGNIICGAAHIKAKEYEAKANGEWRRGHITALECRKNEAELPDDSPFPISASVLRFGAHKSVTCVILINIMY